MLLTLRIIVGYSAAVHERDVIKLNYELKATSRVPFL
jgi:hypothetical protein